MICQILKSRTVSCLRGIGLSILLVCGSLKLLAEEANQEIRIVTPEWASQTSADLSGLYFDIMKKVYPDNSYTIAADIVPWTRASKLIEEKKADVMFASYKGRVDAFFPTIPLDFEDICSYAVGENPVHWSSSPTKPTAVSYVRGYNYDHYLGIKKSKKIRVFEVANEDHAIRMLLIGRVDYYIGTCFDTQQFLNENPSLTDVPMISGVVYSRPLYLRFSKTEKSQRLIKRYDEVMEKSILNGELQALYLKWGVPYSEEQFLEFLNQ